MACDENELGPMQATLGRVSPPDNGLRVLQNLIRDSCVVLEPLLHWNLCPYWDLSS